MEAGETIYIPRKWPHCVFSLTDTVSLTINFLPKCYRKDIVEKVRGGPWTVREQCVKPLT